MTLMLTVRRRSWLVFALVQLFLLTVVLSDVIKVSIVGVVDKPGDYEMQVGDTLADLVREAGKLPPSALNRVNLFRDSKVYTYNLLSGVFPELREGDHLRVPYKDFRGDPAEHSTGDYSYIFLSREDEPSFNDLRNWLVSLDGWKPSVVARSIKSVEFREIVERRYSSTYNSTSVSLYPKGIFLKQEKLPQELKDRIEAAKEVIVVSFRGITRGSPKYWQVSGRILKKCRERYPDRPLYWDQRLSAFGSLPKQANIDFSERARPFVAGVEILFWWDFR